MGLNSLLIILSVLLGGVVVYARHRVSYWRDRFYGQDEVHAEMFDRAIKAEGDKARAEQELAWTKNTIGVIASRNSVAILTDEQAHTLINAIGQLVTANLADPTKLN